MGSASWRELPGGGGQQPPLETTQFARLPGHQRIVACLDRLFFLSKLTYCQVTAGHAVLPCEVPW